jgi:hypothetical protein
MFLLSEIDAARKKCEFKNLIFKNLSGFYPLTFLQIAVLASVNQVNILYIYIKFLRDLVKHNLFKLGNGVVAASAASKNDFKIDQKG